MSIGGEHTNLFSHGIQSPEKDIDYFVHKNMWSMYELPYWRPHPEGTTLYRCMACVGRNVLRFPQDDIFTHLRTVYVPEQLLARCPLTPWMAGTA